MQLSALSTQTNDSLIVRAAVYKVAALATGSRRLWIADWVVIVSSDTFNLEVFIVTNVITANNH